MLCSKWRTDRAGGCTYLLSNISYRERSIFGLSYLWKGRSALFHVSIERPACRHFCRAPRVGSSNLPCHMFRERSVATSCGQPYVFLARRKRGERVLLNSEPFLVLTFLFYRCSRSLPIKTSCCRSTPRGAPLDQPVHELGSELYSATTVGVLGLALRKPSECMTPRHTRRLET